MARRVPPKDEIGWKIHESRRPPLERDIRYKEEEAKHKRELQRLKREAAKKAAKKEPKP
jgi:hypothetical protein